MRIRNLILVSAAMALTSTAFAGTEAFGDYSYFQFNPSVTGVQSRAFNGGGGGFQFNFGKIFGIKGEFQGYGSTEWTREVKSPIPTPGGGIIPAGTYKSNGNMFTYMFGPVIRFPIKGVTPFAEVLFGGSNSNTYANMESALIVGGATGQVSLNTQHPFTMAFGGGLDVNVGKHFALRLAELDYVLTRYTNILTDTNNQNNFRYVGGVVFRFGE
jgi:hypothetical protein